MLTCLLIVLVLVLRYGFCSVVARAVKAVVFSGKRLLSFLPPLVRGFGDAECTVGGMTGSSAFGGRPGFLPGCITALLPTDSLNCLKGGIWLSIMSWFSSLRGLASSNCFYVLFFDTRSVPNSCLTSGLTAVVAATCSGGADPSCYCCSSSLSSSSTSSSSSSLTSSDSSSSPLSSGSGVLGFSMSSLERSSSSS